MRLPRFISFVFCFLLSASGFGAQTVAPPSGDLRAFFGQVTAVNHAAKTISLQLGNTLIFRVTPETTISSASGGAVPFDKIAPGEGAMVTARSGPGGIGVAVKILLVSGVTFAADYSARTIKGENVSSAAVGSYVVYKPPREEFNRGLNFGKMRSGLFLLSIAPDGTVPGVKVLRSLGYEELDARTVKWLKKWRFRPNSLSEARIPVSYHRTR